MSTPSSEAPLGIFVFVPAFVGALVAGLIGGQDIMATVGLLCATVGFVAMIVREAVRYWRAAHPKAVAVEYEDVS